MITIYRKTVKGVKEFIKLSSVIDKHTETMIHVQANLERCNEDLQTLEKGGR